MEQFININLPEFKIAYEKAVEENKDVFTYRNKEFATGYAKYLIEYLETKK